MSRPGRQVHHRVGAPQRRPAQLLDFVLDRRADRRVADVGVDLHLEVAADDHRLELGVIDVGRDDGPAAGDLVADEVGAEALADGDELHLGRDLALARVVQLRDRTGAAQRPPRPRRERVAHVVARRRRKSPLDLRDGAAADPLAPQLGQPVADIEAERAAGVVDVDRRLAARQADAAHGHSHAGLAGDVDLGRVRKGVAVVADVGGRLVERRGGVRGCLWGHGSLRVSGRRTQAVSHGAALPPPV